jgi:2-polyprenyl-6-methoxyphenol hydroxylase-like FAD-dependent oxidoreductase
MGLGEASVPVIVVGGGPVGLMLALDLARYRVPSVVVNTGETHRVFPKGNTHNARTMEHYRRLGLAERVRAVGLGSGHATDVGYFTRLNGYELARLPMPSSREKLAAVGCDGAAGQVPEPIHRANQMYVEAIMLEFARRVPGIELRYGWRCVDFADEGDLVRAVVEHGADGRREALRGQYLVGCDGGQSFVRRRLGIRYEGEASLDQPFYGGAMVSTHLRAPGLLDDLAHAPCWMYWTVNRDCRTQLITLDGAGEYTLQTKLPAGERVPCPQDAVALVRRSVGADVDVEVLGQGTWTAGQALVAETYCAGRVLLCGDAAHLFTPTGGFGMNTGIDDAANLAWKLAAVAKGWGGSGLLDTYELERRPIAVRNTSAAHRLARSVGEVPVAAEIEDDSDAGAAARRAASAYLSTFGEEFASIGIQLGARYDGSPIIASDGTPPPDDPAVYRPSACPGGRTPHLWLGSGRSLFDALGPCFTLLCLHAPDERAHRLRVAAVRRAVPLKLVAITVPEARELYGRDYAVVRPDQHVAWRGDRVPDEADDLLDRLTGVHDPSIAGVTKNAPRPAAATASSTNHGR